MGKAAEKRFFPSIKRGDFIIDGKSECKVTNKNEEFSTSIRLQHTINYKVRPMGVGFQEKYSEGQKDEGGR